MKSYDVNCPVCGHKNLYLYLEETDGWMECEHCKNLSQDPRFVKIRMSPVLPGKSTGPGTILTAVAG